MEGVADVGEAVDVLAARVPDALKRALVLRDEPLGDAVHLERVVLTKEVVDELVGLRRLDEDVRGLVLHVPERLLHLALGVARHAEVEDFGEADAIELDELG